MKANSYFQDKGMWAETHVLIFNALRENQGPQADLGPNEESIKGFAKFHKKKTSAGRVAAIFCSGCNYANDA